jgi:hypothetical protein
VALTREKVRIRAGNSNVGGAYGTAQFKEERKGRKVVRKVRKGIFEFSWRFFASLASLRFSFNVTFRAGFP